MPRILTHSEFDSLSKNSHREPEPTTKTPAPSSPVGKVIEKKTEMEYFLLHPDNGENQKVNGKFIIEFENRIIEIPIVNGVLKTKDEKIKNELILKGMIFMFSKEVTNE